MVPTHCFVFVTSKPHLLRQSIWFTSSLISSHDLFPSTFRHHPTFARFLPTRRLKSQKGIDFLRSPPIKDPLTPKRLASSHLAVLRFQVRTPGPSPSSLPLVGGFDDFGPMRASLREACVRDSLHPFFSHSPRFSSLAHRHLLSAALSLHSYAKRDLPARQSLNTPF